MGLRKKINLTRPSPNFFMLSYHGAWDLTKFNQYLTSTKKIYISGYSTILWCIELEKINQHSTLRLDEKKIRFCLQYLLREHGGYSTTIMHRTYKKFNQNKILTKNNNSHFWLQYYTIRCMGLIISIGPSRPSLAIFVCF